jgi:DNA-binding protein H-NS
MNHASSDDPRPLTPTPKGPNNGADPARKPRAFPSADLIPGMDTPPEPTTNPPSTPEALAVSSAPLPLDITPLPDDVLRALIAASQQELERRAAQRQAEFFELVRERALELGVTPARLAAALAGKADTHQRATGDDGRRHVKMKYWNPSDHAQRWSGRGDPPPQWFRDLLAEGMTREAMLIPEGAL